MVTFLGIGWRRQIDLKAHGSRGGACAFVMCLCIFFGMTPMLCFVLLCAFMPCTMLYTDMAM